MFAGTLRWKNYYCSDSWRKEFAKRDSQGDSARLRNNERAISKDDLVQVSSRFDLDVKVERERQAKDPDTNFVRYFEKKRFV